jgi:signal peptidase
MSSNYRSLLGQVLTVVGAVALLVLVALFVAHAVPALVGAEQSYVVTSDSMSPTIEVGDVIFVYPTSEASIEQGDIIAYTRDGNPNEVTTHRVHEVVSQDGRRGFVTKGDANEEPDRGVVRPEYVVGSVPVVFGYPLSVPYMGYLLRFAGSDTGIVLFLFVPAALLIVSEVYDLAKAARAQRSGSDEDTESKAGTDPDGPEAGDGLEPIPDHEPEPEPDGGTPDSVEEEDR